ncbi:MAG: helix-turn-helix domain-containing protein [Candidatus Methylomirabilales bacterium]
MMDLSSQRKGRLRQLIRCHQILDRLASHRIDYNANLLAEELGFTTKTIYRDLRALKEAGVFIEYDPHRKRYLIGENPLARAYLGEGRESSWVQEAGLGDLSLSLTEASRYLGLSPRRMRALVAAGQIPATQRGRQLRMAIKDLVRLKRLVPDNSQHPGWRLAG